MSESVEMYLKTLFELGMDGEPVAISAVARRLGVSSVSATEMIKRLETQGVAVHTPYKGVELTELGIKRAQAVLRRHRLWESFLYEKLGIAWEQTHDLACTLEHVASDEVTEALAAYLGHPTQCPHGNFIPSPVGEADEDQTTPLNLLDIGDRGVITSVYPEETPMLVYLKEKDILPGNAVTVEDIAPYNGPITMKVNQRQQVIGRTAAAYIHVKRN